MVHIDLIHILDLHSMPASLLPELLAHFRGVILLRSRVVERADLLFGALELLAVLPLVRVRVVELLDRRVGPVAEEALRTVRDVDVLRGVLAVVRHVVEDTGWPSEVPHVVCIQAILRVVRVVTLRAPARLVLVHVEGEALHLLE